MVPVNPLLKADEENGTKDGAEASSILVSNPKIDRKIDR
jgi:hypothetical protein